MIEKDFKYEQIKVSDLGLVDIEKADISELKRIKTKLLASQRLTAWSVLVVLIIWLCMHVYHLQNVVWYSVSSILAMCISISLVYMLILCLKSIVYLKKSKCVKAEYGTLSNKYFVVSCDDRDSITPSKDYYVEVLLGGRCLRDVSCFDNDYGKLKVSDRVLVVSFDGKSAYCLKAN